MYINADIFTIEHPYGDEASCASGKKFDIYNNNQSPIPIPIPKSQISMSNY